MIKMTLTGADERTDLNSLCTLAASGVEIGILYTHDPEGRHRYPQYPWIYSTSMIIGSFVSIHVCGSRARESLHSGRLDSLLRAVKRVQINGVVSPDELIQICKKHQKNDIITQYNNDNICLTEIDVPNHQILVDCSGGRGVLPESWNRPVTTKRVGFAGGLNQDNLETELPRIASVGGGDCWIDIESGVRDDSDWFSVEKCTKTISVFNDILNNMSNG